MNELLRTPPAWPRILLERAGAGDPADLDAAVRAGSYEALKTAVRAMTSGAVAGLVTAAGLRGRGGAGYPTGLKWRAAAAAPSGPKYVVANGYGADPAVRTDRLLMESDPHAVIEGVALAAYAIGASDALHRRPGRGDRGDPPTRGGPGRRDRGRFHRWRRPRVRLVARDRDPTGPGCLHAGRGDGPAEGPRGQARAARATAAAPDRARPVRPTDRRPERPDAGGRALDHPPRPGRLRRDRRRRQPRHDPRPAPRGGRGGDRRGPPRAPRSASSSDSSGRRAAGRSRRSSSADRRAASCRSTCSTRRTPSRRCAGPAPISAPARSWSRTTGPASWTWPGC